MKVTWLESVQRRSRRVALGQFDGVHRGHRRLILGCDTVVTFDPHPQAVLSPHPPAILSPLARKVQLMASLGVQELVLIRFDRARAAQQPEDFVTEVLVDRLQASRVSVGENFRFGHRARGDTALLAADPRFETRIAPLLQAGGLTVSSSRIRAHVRAGELALAAHLLGSPVHLRATVRGLRGPIWEGPVGPAPALLDFGASPALPPHGRYRCDTGAGPATLTLMPAPGRPHDSEGWLSEIDVEAGSEIALDLLAAEDGAAAYLAAAL
jgi:riboflavin kinase/FMN adenylyltransferase